MSDNTQKVDVDFWTIAIVLAFFLYHTIDDIRCSLGNERACIRAEQAIDLPDEKPSEAE